MALAYLDHRASPRGRSESGVHEQRPQRPCRHPRCAAYLMAARAVVHCQLLCPINSTVACGSCAPSCPNCTSMPSPRPQRTTAGSTISRFPPGRIRWTTMCSPKRTVRFVWMNMPPSEMSLPTPFIRERRIQLLRRNLHGVVQRHTGGAALLGHLPLKVHRGPRTRCPQVSRASLSGAVAPFVALERRLGPCAIPPPHPLLHRRHRLPLTPLHQRQRHRRRRPAPPLRRGS